MAAIDVRGIETLVEAERLTQPGCAGDPSGTVASRLEQFGKRQVPGLEPVGRARTEEANVVEGAAARSAPESKNRSE